MNKLTLAQLAEAAATAAELAKVDRDLNVLDHLWGTPKFTVRLDADAHDHRRHDVNGPLQFEPTRDQLLELLKDERDRLRDILFGFGVEVPK
jgi:hypothetical protein